MRFSSRAENADKAASKCVTSVGLSLFWFIGCFWHHFPNEWMCVCLPDIEQLGKHGRLLCSLPPHVLLMGSSSHKANSHSGLGLERDNERGTKQELWPCVMLEHLQPMVGSSNSWRLNPSITDLHDQVRPSYSPLPPTAGLHPCSPCLVCRRLQTHPDRAQPCLCGVCGALGDDRVLVPVVVLWCSLAMQSLRELFICCSLCR